MRIVIRIVQKRQWEKEQNCDSNGKKDRRVHREHKIKRIKTLASFEN